MKTIKQLLKMKEIKPIVKMGGLLCNRCIVVIRPLHSISDCEGKTGPVLCDKCLSDLVYKYPTKSQIGFTGKEYIKLASKFPTLNKERFEDALHGITCQIIDGDLVIYHCDILLALTCGLENRKPTAYEWD
jgi:hypothetical protein